MPRPPLSDTEWAALQRTGAFTVRVVPQEPWLAIRSQQHQPLPWHESVLRPLLQSADAAWAYELNQAPEILAVAGPLLRRVRGKHAIGLGGEPIRGHELLWNASGGQRGSIVIQIPADRFPGDSVFPHCQDAFIVGNASVPHTPGALRYTRQVVADGRQLCCLLSRTNGFEWVSLHATPAVLAPLLLQARALVARRERYAPGGGAESTAR